MQNKIKEAITLSQQEVIAAAVAKLGRELTDAELKGIRGISSLMMLESCFMGFSSPSISPEDVQNDLSHFAASAKEQDE